MKIKHSRSENVFNVFNITILTLFTIACLYPLLYVLFASFSQPSRFFTHYGALWAPLGFSLESFKAVFKNPNIAIGYKNTTFVLLIGTALNMILTIMGGYVISRRYLMHRKLITFLVVFTMYFQGGTIPLYLIVQGLKITDTIWALIFPVAINTYNMIIMRTAFMSIPDEMEESATIDGANQLRILVSVMVPLVGPTLAVLVLYYAVWHWNSFFNAMLFLRTRKLFPLQLILRGILIESSTSDMTSGAALDDVALIAETIKYAVIVVSTAPILVLYPFLQRFFVKGVMIGAVKG